MTCESVKHKALIAVRAIFFAGFVLVVVVCFIAVHFFLDFLFMYGSSRSNCYVRSNTVSVNESDVSLLWVCSILDSSC